MSCKVCNTRLSPGERTCPNCGNDAGPGASFRRKAKQGPLPKPKLSKPNESGTNDSSGELELELDEVTSPPAARPRSSPRTAARPKPRAAKERAPKPPPLFSADPATLRALLADQPEILEAGLTAYRDDDGKSVGASYGTAVGEIDLLARNTDGDLVVVMIMEKGQGEELVAEMLKRLGWVRKHLAEPDGCRVAGIVLCDEAPEDLSYTAAAVSDTVTFKTYRVSLTFDDIEI